MKLWAAISPDGFHDEFLRELEWKKLRPVASAEKFYLFSGEPREVAWAQVIWKRVEKLPIASIGDGAKQLKALGKRWEYLPAGRHRRGSLIHEQLRPYRREILTFPTEMKLLEGTGAFTLLEDNEVLWCRAFDRPDPLGLVTFEEDKTSAPSRAYLKLWEAFSLIGKWPVPGEKTIDLGASPGGWTWVLASLGANVLSVDRAPLEPSVAMMPGVTFRKGDAFQAGPEALGSVDWLCSDVICYPEKLLEFVKQWKEAGAAKHFICTLKFQGASNPSTVEKFAALGRVLHLHHNKHELTWISGI